VEADVDPQPDPAVATPPPGGGWEAHAQAAVPRGPAPGLEYASAWRRLAAWVIDSVILLIPTQVLWTFTVFSGDFYVRMNDWMRDVQRNPYHMNPFGWMDTSMFLGLTVAATLISAAYFVLCWRFTRGTLGQRMLGLLVGNQADGAPLDVVRGLARWIALTLSPFYIPLVLLPWESMITYSLLVTLIFWAWQIALLITVASSPTGQGLHDRLVNSLVVRRL